MTLPLAEAVARVCKDLGLPLEHWIGEGSPFAQPPEPVPARPSPPTPTAAAPTPAPLGALHSRTDPHPSG